MGRVGGGFEDEEKLNQDDTMSRDQLLKYAFEGDGRAMAAQYHRRSLHSPCM